MLDSTSPASRLLTVEQAADVLNVSVRFVRRLISEHRIAVHRLGRHVRLAQEDLDAFIAAGREEAVLSGVSAEGWANAGPSRGHLPARNPTSIGRRAAPSVPRSRV